jgi:hypothetical protein
VNKYERIKNFSSEEFRRLTGVKPHTFELMLSVLIQAERKLKEKGGKPNQLSLPDRLLMALEYLREYRTYFHLGQSYGISESACYRNCRWVEDVLIKSREFSLPGKKALLKSDHEIEIILVDASETPVERPKKKDPK